MEAWRLARPQASADDEVISPAVTPLVNASAASAEAGSTIAAAAAAAATPAR